MPAKLAHGLVLVSMVLMAVGAVSLMARHPFLGFSARHYGGAAVYLVLLSINMHQCAAQCVDKKS